MCSKCYKETISKNSISPSPAPVAKDELVSAPASIIKSVPETSSSPPLFAAPAMEAPSLDVKSGPAPMAIDPVPALVPTSPATTAVTAPLSSVLDSPKKQVNTSRCFACNKKSGLLGFKCKCEFSFCAEHRYSDKHACAFDYKAQGKELLTRANPVIAPKKLEHC